MVCHCNASHRIDSDLPDENGVIDDDLDDGEADEGRASCFPDGSVHSAAQSGIGSFVAS